MDYQKKYLKYKAKYLHFKYRTSSNQVGGDILTFQYREFIKIFRELQNASIKNNDKSFDKVDDRYINELVILEEKERALIEKRKRATSIEEKKQIGQNEEMPLKNEYNQLKQGTNWNNFEKMKNVFYSIDGLSDWVIGHYKEGNIKRVEDIQSRLKPAAENFKWLQKKGYVDKNMKITEFGGLVGLEDFLSKPDIHEKLKEKYKEEGGITEAKEGGDIIYDGKYINIIHPTTTAGSCYYGKGTRWCTSATQAENMFEYYNKKGPLYIIQPKKPERENEKYQLHFENEQFMDEKDEDIRLYDLYKKYQELENLETRVPKLYGYLLASYIGKKNNIVIQEVTNLLNKGADVNIKTEWDKSTPLFNAVLNTDPDALKIVELLLSKGAEVDARNGNYNTPLFKAVQNTGPDALKIIEFLLNKGAKVDVMSETTLTPLSYAVQNTGPDALKIVELLLSKGGKVYARNGTYMPPLFYAVQNDGPDALKIVELLLLKNADVNIKDQLDSTALFKAIENSGPDALKIVELLLRENADVNVEDSKGVTVLFYAENLGGIGASKIVELLKQYGAK